MSHGPVPAAAAGDMLPATTTPPATTTATLNSVIACRARRSRDHKLMVNLPFLTAGQIHTGDRQRTRWRSIPDVPPATSNSVKLSEFGDPAVKSERAPVQAA